jgi:ribose transport system substrate-binding protein
MKAVRKGTIDATMVQQTQRMGRMSVDTVLDILHKKKVPAKQLLPAYLLTKDDKEKATEYIKKHP